MTIKLGRYINQVVAHPGGFSIDVTRDSLTDVYFAWHDMDMQMCLGCYHYCCYYYHCYYYCYYNHHHHHHHVFAPWFSAYLTDSLHMSYKYNPWGTMCRAPFPGQTLKVKVTRVTCSFCQVHSRAPCLFDWFASHVAEIQSFGDNVSCSISSTYVICMCDFMTCFVRNDEIKLRNQSFPSLLHGSVAIRPNHFICDTNTNQAVEWATHHFQVKISKVKLTDTSHSKPLPYSTVPIWLIRLICWSNAAHARLEDVSRNISRSKVKFIQVIRITMLAFGGKGVP